MRFTHFVPKGAPRASLLVLGLALAAGATVAGCGDEESAAKSGNLGHGQFLYDCLTRDDAVCPDLSPKPFPAEIALDSRFEVSFAASESTRPVGSPSWGTITVRPVIDTWLLQAGTAFRATHAGDLGLLALAANGQIVDETTLHVVTPRALQLFDGQGVALDGALTLAAGTTESVRGVPIGSLGEAMAGVIDFTWVSSDLSVVQVSATPGARMTVKAVAPGSATVTIDGTDVASSLKVTVQ